MKKNITFLILLCLAKTSFGQDFSRIGQYFPRMVDSLTGILNSAKDDTSRVNAYNVLSKRLWMSEYNDRAIYNANQALILSKKVNFKKGIANAYNNLGVAFMKMSNYPEALKNHLIALQVRKEIGDKSMVGISYINIGNVYIQMGNYPEALKNYFNALKTGEEIGDKTIIADAEASSGNIYVQMGNYQEALKSHLAALKIMKEEGDIHGIAMTYTNIGYIYNKQGNYSEALNFLLSALELEKLEKNIGDNLAISILYGNIGNVYMLQGKFSEALKSYLNALSLQQQMNYKYGLEDSYINLGKIYLKLYKLSEAKNYLYKGLALARQAGNKDQLKDAYGELAKLDSSLGNINGAFQYFKLYSQMKDSVVNEESNKQISQLKIQYETDKKDAQINTQNFRIKAQELSLQNQILQNKILQTRIYYSLAITLIVILFFYLRNVRKKKEYDHKMIDLELTALKSQLNPHFIFNALMSIEMYIDANPQTGTGYLNQFSQLMRGVLESSEEKEISLTQEMGLMKHYIELEKLRLSNKLNYSVTYDSSIDADQTMIPSLITQPIIENAIWHGLTPPDKNRELNIHNSLSENKLIITISSNALNGKTNNVTLHKRKSFGLKITRERLALLKQTVGKEGNLSVEIQPEQTVAVIVIPLKKT